MLRVVLALAKGSLSGLLFASTTLTLRTFVFAAGGDTTVDPTSIAQYGIAGVIGYFLIQFMRATLDKERARADRLEAALLEANKSANETAITALASATAAIAEATKVANEWKKERDAIVQRSQRKRSGD